MEVRDGACGIDSGGRGVDGKFCGVSRWRSSQQGDREPEGKIALFDIRGRLAWQRRVFATDDLHVFECQAPGAGIWFVCLDGNCVKLVSLK